MKDLIPREVIERKIYITRGHKVMLSMDLARLYGVDTKVLVQAVKRNRDRFPDDFMFQLTWDEIEFLRSQIVTLHNAQGRHIKHLPYAFTEQGVAMLSGILRSKLAVQVNIAIMRAFVRLRGILLMHKDLAAKIEALELKYKNHDIKLLEYDKHIEAIFEAMRQLMAPPEPPKRRIGFHAD